jgi:stage V sporulation protein AD
MSVQTSSSVKRRGQYSVALDNVRFLSRATVVGPKEGQGLLGRYFDEVETNEMAGENTAEKAERYYLNRAIQLTLQKAGIDASKVHYLIAGDLLNQIISSNFTARQTGIPFLGIYNACATFAEGLGLGSIIIDGSFADTVMVAVSSNYLSAERQYRYPIELNIQRKDCNQMTVSGAGACLLARDGTGPRISLVTFGRVIDYGLKDVNDMGSAMAPAAFDTLIRHLTDTNQNIGDYDLILTGDLGKVGSKMFRVLAKEAGLTLGNTHMDCGCMLFKPQQNAYAGGSGAACSAIVILGYILSEMENTKYHKVLILPTGSLHSPLSYQQKESIPCIAHAITLEM